MSTIGVNAPKTPVTAGSGGKAPAMTPNVCKMPGPPAPFVPTPLPNVGASGDSLTDGSTTVLFEGKKVAIKGSYFKSTGSGDAASQGTGGGIISSTTQGKTEWVAPGSMDVKIEGKNIQLLGDAMTNNGQNPTNGGTSIAQQDSSAGGVAGDPKDKCAKLVASIDEKINRVRPPTPPGGFPQGLQGLARRWQLYADPGCPWVCPDGTPGKKAVNEFREYKKTQVTLNADLQSWDKNGCEGKGYKLPDKARAYAAQDPVFRSGVLGPT